MILRIVSLRAWWTKGVAVAFMYCSISVLASVVALNNVVASSGYRAQARKVWSIRCRFLSWSHSTDKPKQEAQPCSKMTHLIQHVYIVGLWGKSWVNPAIKQSFPLDFTSHFCYHLLAFLPSMLISLSLSVLSRGASAFSCLKIRSSRLANKVRSWPHTWARA